MMKFSLPTLQVLCLLFATPLGLTLGCSSQATHSDRPDEQTPDEQPPDEQSVADVRPSPAAGASKGATETPPPQPPLGKSEAAEAESPPHSDVDQSAAPEESPSDPVMLEPEDSADREPEEETPAGTSTPAHPQDASLQASRRSSPDALFQDWPTPELVLFVTGQQHGYIEPCGCTGLENQKGGLARRHRLVQHLEERGWPVVPVDAGNQIRRFGRQAEVKFQFAVEGLKTMGYRSIALGVDDLQLSVGELVATTVAVDGQESAFVSANAAVLDRSMTPAYHVVEAGGKKIGITAIVGAEWQDRVSGAEIMKMPPEEGLDEVLPKLRDAGCDLLVLLAHASIDESKRLARDYPDFQVVVTADGEEPTYRPETIDETGTMFTRTGNKGMYVGIIGLFDDPEQPLRYQRVPLDARFSDSRAMLDLLASYQEELKQLGLEGLGLEPVPHPSGREFVGTEKCSECHVTEYEIWEGTRHADAMEALVHPPNSRSEIPRHFDPECLSCHVVGWHPQRYYPYTSGYLGLEKTPEMHNVGCENCHGPGARHVAAEYGELDVSDEGIEQLRESMRLPLAEAEESCRQCHDLDNDPHFQEPGAFAEYWEHIEH